MKKLGIYVHIPFCRSKCPYCDFFSLPDKECSKEYITAVNDKVLNFTKNNSCKVDTLYIGGGTPSALSGGEIASVIQTVKKSFNCAIDEVTVECNPSDVSEDFFEKIFSSGANRLSFGMQSAVDSERRALGRRADKKQVEKAVELARKIGFENISLDLMLGIPKQTSDSLSESIKFCADLGVQHISAYILKLEEGTWFYKNLAKLELPDDDKTADFYLQAVSELEQNGFEQYEISNFSKAGYESKHNLKYWNLEEYLGIGAAAHSYLGGKRFYYPRDINYFINGGEPLYDGEGGTAEEKIMLGLRLKKGILISLLSEKAKKELPFLSQQGYTEINGNRLSLTAKGFLVSNSIINTLI